MDTIIPIVMQIIGMVFVLYLARESFIGIRNIKKHPDAFEEELMAADVMQVTLITLLLYGIAMIVFGVPHPLFWLHW